MKHLNKLLRKCPEFCTTIAIGLMVIAALSCLTGCNKLPPPVPDTKLGDQCFRDGIKSCRVTLEIEFKEEK